MWSKQAGSTKEHRSLRKLRRRSQRSHCESCSPPVPARRASQAKREDRAEANAPESLISGTTATASSRRASQRRLRDATGTLILIGGGATPSGAPIASFLELTGAADGAPIVGFTTASSQVALAPDMWLADFKRAGATNVTIPIVDDREQAANKE